MGITELTVVRGFMRLCDDGWKQGWHERNGGNLTYRLTPDETAACRPFCDETPRPWVNLPVRAEGVAGETFLTTGSGKYFRNVWDDPAANIGVVEIRADGGAYRVLWGLENGATPTSEFPSHLLNHCVRKAATGGACRVMYHAHPANITAMTYVLPLTAKAFSRALWQSETECPVVFPGGVGVVAWMVPGGAEIARATSEVMRDFDAAVWAHHGLFASGPDFDTTFGLMHTIEKAADIFVRVQSMGGARQTIPDAGLRDIARAFGVTLRESFLEE